MSITACKSGKLLRSRSGIWRVNASLDRGDILYPFKTAWGTISMSYLSDGAISIRSRHIALSMDACKLHSNSLTASAATLAGWLNALCILRGCNGGGQVPRTRMYGGERSFVPLFYRYFIGAPWYTIHHGWEALWYVTDMNIIPPLPFPPRPSRRHFAAATRNAIRIPLSWSCASYNVIVADTMMVVNTFQTGMASDTLHDNHSILRPSRECMCNGWG